MLDRLGFGNFNKPFQPARTELDWLSRDEAEVDKYIEDPLCGGPYTTGLWLDLMAGLMEVGSDAALRRIDAALPILITGGEVDPVGGDKGMTKLLRHYAQTGHQRLRVKIYPDGRHEMLNETNRDEVTRDWLDWILATSRSARSG
jgi:alpha-beta hydrolase superfamily lysophospholipase